MTPSLLLALVLSAEPPLNATAFVEPVRAEARKVAPGMVKLYEWLHQNPELSNQEKETARRMSLELKKLGMEVVEGVGGTGVVGVLRGKKPGAGPVILVRADMDALPVTEATGLTYASKKPGAMHACGHDLHMTHALGAYAVLKALEKEWSGTVLAVMQPAEETGPGAAAMIKDPKFQQLLERVGRPVLALAIHDASDSAAGVIWVQPGFTSANVDSIEIVVHGRGGHGAHPDRTIDPVVIGASIIVELQSIVSRRVKPTDLAVITVGKFEGGTKHNIIPSTAHMLLTVRSYGDEMRNFLLDEIKRVAVNVARAHAAPEDPEVTVDPNFVPSTYNDPVWTERLRELFVAAVGPSRVLIDETKSAGGEDFGQFPKLLGIPGVMYGLGAQPQALIDKVSAAELPSLHSDRFAPDAANTLSAGIPLFALAILEGLASAPLPKVQAPHD
jgi:amidohydrolase